MKKGLIFGLVVVAMAVLFGVGFFLGQKRVNSDEKCKEEEKISVRDSGHENSFYYYDLIKLQYKLSLMLSMENKGLMVVFSDKDMKLSDFSDEDLVSLALNISNKEDIKKIYGNFDEEEGLAYYSDTDKLSTHYDSSNDNVYWPMTYYATDKEIKNSYKYLFNKELTTFPEKTHNSICSNSIYSTTRHMYLIYGGCGGTGFPVNYTYVYDIDFDRDDENNKYYNVYIAYGVGTYDDDGRRIYSDYYDGKKLYKFFEKEDPETFDYSKYISLDSFEINASNYHDFAKYMMVFEEVDGEFYFTEIKKL